MYGEKKKLKTIEALPHLLLHLSVDSLVRNGFARNKMTSALGSWSCFVEQHCSVRHWPGLGPSPSYLTSQINFAWHLLKKKKKISVLRKKWWILLLHLTFGCALASSGCVSLKKALFLPFLHGQNWEEPAAWKETSFSWFPELQKCLDNLERNSDSPACWCEACFRTLRFVTSIWQTGLFVD